MSVTLGRRVDIVLFACVHNAGRSKMAAALFNRLVDPSRARAVSAGTEPGSAVHPEVVAVMNEVGIDLSAETPSKLTQELAATADRFITMGCGEACPYVPGIIRDDWPLEDPKGKSVETVRVIREDIQRRVESLIAREQWAPDASPHT
jgi:arsenate reductase